MSIIFHRYHLTQTTGWLVQWRVLMQRWAGYASTRVRHAQRHADEGDRLKEAVKDAAHTGLPGFPNGTFDWGTPGDATDSTACTDEDDPCDADVDGHDPGVLDDEGLEQLGQVEEEETDLAAQLLLPHSQHNSPYLMAAFQAVPDARAMEPGAALNPSHVVAVHSIDSERPIKQPGDAADVKTVERRAMVADEAAVHYRPPLAINGSTYLDEAQRAAGMHQELHVWYSGEADSARARIHLYVTGQRAAPSVIVDTPSGNPPFVKTAEPPSIGVAMDLFTLGRDQRIAFAHMAESLLQTSSALRDGLPPPPQRSCLIMGGPGTGKCQAAVF